MDDSFSAKDLCFFKFYNSDRIGRSSDLYNFANNITWIVQNDVALVILMIQQICKRSPRWIEWQLHWKSSDYAPRAMHKDFSQITERTSMTWSHWDLKLKDRVMAPIDAMWYTFYLTIHTHCNIPVLSIRFESELATGYSYLFLRSWLRFLTLMSWNFCQFFHPRTFTI